MILGHPVEKRTVKLISVVSLVCVCGAAGLYYISDQYANEDDALELLAAEGRKGVGQKRSQSNVS